MDSAPATTPDTAASESTHAEPTAGPATAPRFAAVSARLRAGVDELSARAKDLGARAQHLQARVKELPADARTRALALVARVRIALDLPSRSEIAELTARLDRLDQRIATLSGAAPAGTLTDGASESTAAPANADAPAPAGADVPDHTRKDKRRNHAAKSARR